MDAMTGAGGFLGWHVRALAHLRGHDEARRIRLGRDADPASIATAVEGADRVLHLAGVSRASDDDLRDGNVLFAEQLARAVTTSDRPPATIVYANSIQSGAATAYGQGKERALEVLQVAADAVGADLVDLRLPNVFGEHGRPQYNSCVATFCDDLTSGREPRLHVDIRRGFVSAQTSAEFVLGERPASDLASAARWRLVSEVMSELIEIDREYSGVAVPALDGGWRRDLVNAYRSFSFARRPVIDVDGHVDDRGAFHEIVRSDVGGGQTSYSTTVPGVTRGQHVHRRKVERFCVVGGDAVIRLRRLLTGEVVEIPVSGDHPVAVDIPTLWAHSIVAVGDRPVQTIFWVDEPFDPARPDTYQEDV